MPKSIRAIEYCYIKVNDEPGAACNVLRELSERGVNLLVFHVIPATATATRLAVFPESFDDMIKTLSESGLEITGPYRAILIRGDDELGALVEIHRKLYDAGINIASSSGITDSRNGFGYVVYLHPDDIDRALLLLEV